MVTRTAPVRIPAAALLFAAPGALAFTEAEVSALIQQATERATTQAMEADAEREAGGTPADLPAPSAAPAFAESGYASIQIEFAAAFTENNEDYQLRVGYSEFLVDDFEFSVGLSAWYHDQKIDNQASASFDLAFRYHILKEDVERGVSPSWTVYGETGIGVMISSGDVPDLGSEFNFIPRAGGGVTFRPFSDSAMRMNVGVRWHHISNASTPGSDENPDRDAAMIFTGIIIPL